MAVRSLLEHEVSDLCLGKPALKSIPVSATVGQALSALKRLGKSCLSVWHCDHLKDIAIDFDDCRCVGKVCMVDVICFLCKEDNLACPATALQAPVTVLISKFPGLVRHLEPNSRLVDAIDVILEGAHNVVIPIQTRNSTIPRKRLLQKDPSSNSTLHKNNLEYCWLTREDIIRYLLNCIGLFSPTPVSPINSLNIIDSRNILAVHFYDPASSALPLVSQSLIDQSSVAIVDAEGKLVGEISPVILSSCDETVAAAISTLSAGDLMTYIDCGDPPEELLQLVKDNLEKQNHGAFLDLMEEDTSMVTSSPSSCSTSSDEEFGFGRNAKFGGYSARFTRRLSEPIVCYPWSSLVAVMVQALAHRVSYVWVVEADGTLSGIVTYAAMLEVFRDRMRSMA